MKVLITGAEGFIARNLRQHLAERKGVEVVTFGRADGIDSLPAKLQGVDFVFHLAGVNRPPEVAEFEAGNHGLTMALADAIGKTGQRPAVVISSSTQAELDNPYGRSKRRAEDTLRVAAARTGFAAHIFRLPNVFGKWCKPNYNSVVATFCHNIARGLPVQVNDPNAVLRLVYVDDVVAEFLQLLEGRTPQTDASGLAVISPQYSLTVGALERHLRAFRDSRSSLLMERVGSGLVRALYSTYVSYFPKDAFSYALTQHADARGVFVEMLKTPDSGQFSFFTAHRGVTRGGHYHHSKTEKFLVIRGTARFGFRNIDTGEKHEIVTSGQEPTVVETVPGWTHDITNIGADDLIVMLWANEIFDRRTPDTFPCAVEASR